MHHHDVCPVMLYVRVRGTRDLCVMEEKQDIQMKEEYIYIYSLSLASILNKYSMREVESSTTVKLSINLYN